MEEICAYCGCAIFEDEEFWADGFPFCDDACYEEWLKDQEDTNGT